MSRDLPPVGPSGAIARVFQNNHLTPLLAILAIILGVLAVVVTPKEEEPQIDVTMADIMVAFPGASTREVESAIATPAEQVMSEIQGVEHVYSVSRQGQAVITVQFEVGIPRQEALVRLYNQVYFNQDWLPANLGATQPVIKPKGIDDVPVMTLTLYDPVNGHTGEIGIMPGHALLGREFTATSMIGMIALAGIIVRNSILLVVFIRQLLEEGVDLDEAVVLAGAVRIKPIALTAISAMVGAYFILNDPIFNGLAISLIFGLAMSTLLTVLVVPLLYYTLARCKWV